MKHQRYAFTLSWIDMTYAMLAVFAFLFIMAFVQMNPPAKPGVEQKAEYLITMEWPEGNLDDVDLHLLLPDKKMVDFRNREVGEAMLDHDDLGVNGMYVGPDGKMLKLPEHKEVISLRAIVPGRYVVNVHVYRINQTYGGFVSEPKLPYPVKVKLIKLNPVVQELASATLMMEHLGQQKTAFEFELASDGSAVVKTDVDVPFIPTLPQMTQ